MLNKLVEAEEAQPSYFAAFEPMDYTHVGSSLATTRLLNGTKPPEQAKRASLPRASEDQNQSTTDPTHNLSLK